MEPGQSSGTTWDVALLPSRGDRARNMKRAVQPRVAEQTAIFSTKIYRLRDLIPSVPSKRLILRWY